MEAADKSTMIISCVGKDFHIRFCHFYAQFCCEIAFSEGAKPVLEDLQTARRDYESSRLAALEPDEVERYSLLSEKIQTHIRNILQ